MKNTATFTTTGNSYWHFHPIGVGIIYTYHVRAMQVLTTCELSGQLINSVDYYNEGGLTKEQFKSLAADSYKKLIEEGVTITLDYMDDPTIVGCVGVDFDILMN